MTNIGTGIQARLRRAIGAGGLLTVTGLVVSLGSLAFNVLMARRGGAEVYGAAGVLLSLGNLGLFLAVGCQYAIARRAAVSARPLRRQLGPALATTWPWISLSVLMLALAYPAAAYLHINAVPEVLLAVAVFAATAVLNPLLGMLIGRERFWVLSAVNLLAMLVRVGAGLLLVSGPSNAVHGALLATLVSVLVLGVATIAYVVLAEPPAPHASRRAAQLQAMSLSGDGLVGTVLAIAVYGVWAVPLFFARHGLALDQAGQFASAQVLATGALLLSSPVTAAYLPAVARRPGKVLVLAGLAQTVLVAAGASALLLVGGPRVVAPLYGAQFGPAVDLLPPLAVSAVVLSAASYSLWMTRAALRFTRPLVCGSVVGAVTAVVAGVLLQRSAVGLALVPALAAAVAMLGAALMAALQSGTSRSARVAAVGEEWGLRILVLNWKDLQAPGAGGAERYIARIAERWRADGHGVTVMVPSVRGLPSGEAAPGLRVIRRGNKLSIYWHARRFVRSHLDEFDIVVESACHRPFFTNEEGAPNATVIYYHLADEQWRHEYPFPLDWIGRRVLEPMWARRLEAANVIAISPSTAADLAASGVRPAAVVLPGADHSPGAPRVRPSRAPRLVFLGRLVRSKRPIDAIRAFQLVRDKYPEATLDVVGDGYLLNRLRAEAPRGVIFHGFVDDARKSELLDAADLMVLPATHEGWGLVAIEAAAHGVPVVAYDVAGLRDAIIDGVTGVLTAPRPTALGHHAVGLLRDGPRWAAMSDAGRRRAAGLDWGIAADRVLRAALEPAEVVAPAAQVEGQEVGDEVGDLAPPPTWPVASPLARLTAAATGRMRRPNPNLAQRRLTATGLAVVAILLLGVAGVGPASEIAAIIAVVAIVYAVFAGVRESLPLGAPWRRGGPDPGSGWRTSTPAVGLTAALAVQTWFSSGVIAEGDMTPPGGTAWLGRMLDPWTWSGSDLGAPGTLQRYLPWAAIVSTVQGLGGSAALAQRFWYTLLFAGAALGALWLLRQLGLRPLGASCGALVYVFNAYVITTVNVNPVFLCALALLPTLPAVLLSAARGRISARRAAATLGLAGPMLGFAGLNPPLVGMLVGAAMATPLVAAWMGGREAARRCARALLLGTPILLLTSAYWLLPFLLQLNTVASGRLAAYSDWAWTQSRATLSNGFWLNDSWAWQFPQLFPYAANYDSMPLIFLRFLLPAFAFASLLVAGAVGRNRARDLRLAVLGASTALLVIVLSVGTNPPIGAVFSFIYALPMGWLLREPGRFLMVAGLAYGVMVGVSIEAVAAALPALRAWARLPAWMGPRPLAGAMASIVLALVPGYPLAIGAVVPEDTRVSPPGHVQVPDSWLQMAAYVDARPEPGSVLVLPGDDFYQMPYTWGYYGTDEFIPQMFTRRVLVPNDHNYSPASPAMLAGVVQASDAVTQHRWTDAAAILRALDSRFVLVRGDIDPTRFRDRHIEPPAELRAALELAPNIRIAHVEGQLTLYAVDQPGVEPPPVTVTTDAAMPDLRALPHLPAGGQLVQAEAAPDRARMVQVPPVTEWEDDGKALRVNVTEPGGWQWKLVRLDTGRETPMGGRAAGAPGDLGDGMAAAESAPDSTGGRTLTLSIPTAPDLVANGNLATGEWENVGDCHDVGGPAALSALDGRVINGAAPGGGAALRLSASRDSACESRYFLTDSGPLLVSVSTRHVSGLPPRVSLWEFGPNKFAQLSPPVPGGDGWTRYRAVVIPDAGTYQMQLFVHSDADATAVTTTVNDYAAASVIKLPAAPVFVLVGTPTVPTRADTLAVTDQAFDSRWVGPTRAQHVVVNGVVNGWILPPGATWTGAHFESAPVLAAAWVSALTAAAIAAFAVVSGVRRFRRRVPRMRRDRGAA